MSNWHQSLNMTNWFFHRINVKSATWFEHHTLFFHETGRLENQNPFAAHCNCHFQHFHWLQTFIGCKHHKCIECVALWQGNTCTEARCTLRTVFQSVVLQLRVRNLLRPTLHEPKCGHCCSFPWKTSSTNWTLQGWTKSFPWLLVKTALNLTSTAVCLGNLQCTNTLSCFILIHPNHSQCGTKQLAWNVVSHFFYCHSILLSSSSRKVHGSSMQKNMGVFNRGLQLQFCCVCIYIVNIHNYSRKNARKSKQKFVGWTSKQTCWDLTRRDASWKWKKFHSLQSIMEKSENGNLDLRFNFTFKRHREGNHVQEAVPPPSAPFPHQHDR